MQTIGGMTINLLLNSTDLLSMRWWLMELVFLIVIMLSIEFKCALYWFILLPPFTYEYE